MAIATFNTVRITQLDTNISRLKTKTDLLLDGIHLHENHLPHLDVNLQQTPSWQIYLNQTFVSLWKSQMLGKEISICGPSPRKCRQICKASQHQEPYYMTCLMASSHTPWTLPIKKNLVPLVKFASDLFQIKASHLYVPATQEFTLILQIPMVSNTNLLDLYKFMALPIHFNFSANISITPDVRSTKLLAIGHSKLSQTISKSDLHYCLHGSDTFFYKERKVQFGKIMLRGTLPHTWKPSRTRSKLPRPEEKYLSEQKAPGLYTLQGQSIQTRCALTKTQWYQNAFNPELWSLSFQAATFVQCITSSHLTSWKP